MPITWLDIVVLIFMLISALLAMARGFTREFLSILSWVGAALATLWVFPRYQGAVRAAMEGSPKWLADIVLVFGVFLVTLIVISFITIKIADKILDSRAGALDRTFSPVEQRQVCRAFGVAIGTGGREKQAVNRECARDREHHDRDDQPGSFQQIHCALLARRTGSTKPSLQNHQRITSESYGTKSSKLAKD